ncbi:MAG TPA: hypothetical protein VFR73_24740 [Hyphomicrobiaceae bacterium]|nr:hypothetical protein [Hyphomicrobiaceae bacterium]
MAMPGGMLQICVPSVGPLGDAIHAEVATCTGDVLDNRSDLPECPQAVSDHARDNVLRTASRETHDELDRQSGRVALLSHGGADHQRYAGCSCACQKMPAE